MSGGSREWRGCGKAGSACRSPEELSRVVSRIPVSWEAWKVSCVGSGGFRNQYCKLGVLEPQLYHLIASEAPRPKSRCGRGRPRSHGDPLGTPPSPLQLRVLCWRFGFPGLAAAPVVTGHSLCVSVSSHGRLLMRTPAILGEVPTLLPCDPIS